MRVIVALGGNALLRRGERPDSATQLRNVAAAAGAVAAVAREHDVVVAHGNGPQVGLLALESSADTALSAPYPLDVLGAESEGMIGYWLAQQIGNELPGRQVATVLTQTVVDPADSSFARPTKFIGPVYDESVAHRLAQERGWAVERDGAHWRRVVPSPRPLEIVELPAIELLVRSGVLVVCGGGGGVPVVRDAGGRLAGAEAVVDKDFTAALLGIELRADALLMLTDVDAVYADWGTPSERRIERLSTKEARTLRFPAGSMGPKMLAAADFVESGGGLAAIGALTDAPALLTGAAGTTVVASPA